MVTVPKEPRQWWIDEDGLTDEIGFNEDDGAWFGPYVYTQKPSGKGIIHVIEYSAYQSLLESLILAKKQRDEFELKNVQLKLSLSYLAKIPTEPYEKEMAKKIIELEAELKEVDETLIAIARLVKG